MVALLKRRLSPGGSSSSSGYLPVDQDEAPNRPVAARIDGELEGDDSNRHFGWRKWALFWVPAICDMSGTTVSARSSSHLRLPAARAPLLTAVSTRSS